MVNKFANIKPSFATKEEIKELRKTMAEMRPSEKELKEGFREMGKLIEMNKKLEKKYGICGDSMI